LGGKAIRWSPFPLQMSTTEPFVQLGKVFTIRPLCQASADYCLERERRARTAQRGIQEKLTTDRGQIPAKAKQLGNDLTVQPDSPRRRGRPAIGAEIKRQALEVKQMPGKTNKDVAKILYGTTYPTLAQVRNVTTILRHFQKTSGVKKL
jgi:hypothetical protein